MPEIRIDPLTGQRAIIAAERAGRAGALLAVGPPPALEKTGDPFAAGNESQTPPELFAVRPDGSAPDTPGWRVRVVPNRYPALTPDSPAPEPDANRDLFWSGPAVGAHEVIINAPESVASLGALSSDQLATAVDVWRERMRAHADAPCVHVSVNERAQAGSTVAHTHAQLFALDFVPAAIARERERFGAYATRTMGGNLLADLVQNEVRKRDRIVAIDDEAVLMSPYGARVPYQLLIAPRTPRMRFEDDGPTGAAMLHGALGRLARLLGASPPLNLWVRTAPQGSDHFCWRIDILPALTHPGGLELGTDLGVNVVPPEQAAAEPATREAQVRALIQRVNHASVDVNDRRVGEIGPGLLVLLGVTHGDTEAQADWLADKIRALRIFPDADGRMNEPLGDREVLCVSQFTLYGDARRGNRPSYVAAAAPDVAEPLYERVCELLSAQRGEFGAHMIVSLVNDGPVTLLVESR